MFGWQATAALVTSRAPRCLRKRAPTSDTDLPLGRAINLDDTAHPDLGVQHFCEMHMVGDPTITLIPRKTFFENANALNPRLSPDGRWLAWIAAVDNVMNVWVGAAGRSRQRPATDQPDRPADLRAVVRAHQCARAVPQGQGRRREFQPLVRRHRRLCGAQSDALPRRASSCVRHAPRRPAISSPSA